MHTIRLRRPWDKTHSDSTEVLRVNVPDVSEVEKMVETSYLRRFNRPTGLEKNDRVLLRIDSWQGKLLSVKVNDVAIELDAIDGGQLVQDITAALRPSNTVRIDLMPTDQAGCSLNGEVTLAIEEGTGTPTED